MLELPEAAPFDLDLEKVEQMVMQINNKWASLQRQVANFSQNQSTSFHDSHGDYSITSEAKFQLASGREGSPLCKSDNAAGFSSPHSSKSRSVTYRNERELFVAATDLCQYLNGGVDYRAICVQYQFAMEILLRLLREDLQIARKMDVLPGGTIDHIFNTFSDLFREGKHLLAVNGVIKNDSGTAEHCFSLTTAIPTNGIHERNPAMTDSHFTSASESSARRSAKKKLNVTIGANNDGSDKSALVYEPLRLNTCGDAFTGEDYEFRFPDGTPRDEVTGLPQSTNIVNNTQTSTNESNVSPSVVKTQGTDSISRDKRLEELYNMYWKSDGINMINDMIQMVFLKEYDQSVKKNKRKYDYLRFKRDLEERVLSSLKDYDTFQSSTEDHSELRSDYVVNCLHNHVKPNEKVLDILSTPSVWRGTSSFVLSNMHLGDAGVKSLAPLLPRLGQVHLLDLSSNDIHDTGVADLCTGLLKHPVLESLDLSNNPLTDASAKALLNLATENIHLKEVGCQGIKFSPNTQQALDQRLQHNKNRSVLWLPPGFVSGNAGYDRGDLWRPVLSARLAPIITPVSTPVSEEKKPALNGEFHQKNTSAPGVVRDTTVHHTLGVLQRIRLPYRTAQLGNLRNSRRASQSSSR
ncbi:Leucine-rich repeat [Trypanosoma melophagium]|uniref:Leucine-rich repeat n=1 Tax=Trypanosoma melophagium TaxID=715481 RepID=UPI00351A0E27|nr:Leucine-rich repeat [Trypanosoma melophagium]